MYIVGVFLMVVF